jgi:hypothetical protein
MPDEWWIAVHGYRSGWASAAPVGLVQFVRRWLTGDIGLAEVQPVGPGDVHFLPQTEDERWGGQACHVTVEFKPSLRAILFARADEDVRTQIAPAQLHSLGARGDRDTPIHASITFGYRPEDEGQVIQAIEELSDHWGMPIAEVVALDGTPGWPAGRRRPGH